MSEKKLDNNDLRKIEEFFNKGKFHEGLSFLNQLKKENDDLMLNWYLSHIYFKLHKYDEALKYVKEFINLKSNDLLNLNFLGQIYLEKNRIELAVKTFEQALAIKNDDKTTILNLAKVFLYIGEIDKSKSYFQKLSKSEPENLSYIYSLMRINDNKLTLNLIEKIKKNLDNYNLENKMYGNLILAKFYENEKNYDLEVENLIEAHKVYISSKKKSSYQQINFIKNLLPTFIKEFNQIDFISKSKLNPIFIMGLPRSGTTLVEKIITSGKKKLQSLGESDVFDKVFFSEKIIENYESETLISKFQFNNENIKILDEKIMDQLHAQGLKKNNNFFIDKSISNFLYIDLIYKIYPNAKFVYCYRNPAANVLGIFRSFLPNVLWSHSLEVIFDVVDFYYKKLNQIKSEKIMNIYKLDLENLTDNPEIVSKDLFRFLDLEWTSDCIKNINKNLIIKTASNLQVRKEIEKHDLSYTSNYINIFKKLGFNYRWLN